MRIGPWQLPNNIILAPMAGVTDRPFRQLCRRLGAGMTVSEMITADTRLWHTDKTRRRMDHQGETEPRVVQIAGAEPQMLAHAARLNEARGAQIIDINMGCPAKKVCRRLAGSALLADEALVARILEAVTRAVTVPVTLKIRTGPAPERRNALRIARLAEDCGIAALTIHGRTRADAYRGHAEYDTIATVVNAVDIPVIANGDICSPRDTLQVLSYTGAAGVMIGRAAQGRPWLFREITHFLAHGSETPPPDQGEIRQIMLEHLDCLHAFYGEHTGVRVARKHLGWYLQQHPAGAGWRARLMQIDTSGQQKAAVTALFEGCPPQWPLSAPAQLAV